MITSCGSTEVASTTATPRSTLEPSGLTYVVQRGRVVRTMEFNGRIAPVEEMPLYFKTPGYVRQVHVRQGDQVKAGDLLAELETDVLLNQIAQAEVALNAAQLLQSEAEKALEQEAALAALNLKVAQTRLTQAEDANAYAITQAELTLTLAQEELSRTQILQTTYSAGIVRARVSLEQAQAVAQRAEIEHQEALDRPWESPEAHDDYAVALQLAQWNLEVAQAQYNQAVAESSGYQHEIKMRGIAVEMAQGELEQLKKGVDPLSTLEVQRAQQTLDWLEDSSVDPALVNDVATAQLALEGLQSQLANAQIVAPADGEIVSLAVQPGRPVEAFRAVIVIAGPSAIEVSADLSSDQLKEMTEGQSATIVLSTDPSRTWSGTVSRLPYPYGTAGGTESETETVADNSTRISLKGDTSALNLGDLVHVTIVLEEKDDVLWLPPTAVRTLQGRTFVIVQDGERQSRVDVELGIQGQERVEVVQGLQEGQVVIAP